MAATTAAILSEPLRAVCSNSNISQTSRQNFTKFSEVGLPVQPDQTTPSLTMSPILGRGYGPPKLGVTPKNLPLPVSLGPNFHHHQQCTLVPTETGRLIPGSWVYFGLHISKTAKTVGRLAQFLLIRSGPNLHKILSYYTIVLKLQLEKIGLPDCEKWGV